MQLQNPFFISYNIPITFLLTIWLATGAGSSVAQGFPAEKRQVEWKAGAEKLTPQLLAHSLTDPYKTEREKVSSIFRWITDNIAYRTSAYYGWQKASFKRKTTEPDTLLDNLTLNERVACNVLQQGLAVCDGYARLFKTLCDYSGIRSEIITGFARNNAGRISTTFRSNHSWNAVRIDSAWQLLDVTWASGYFTYNSAEFIRFYNDAYFLPQPANFIADHYPEDLRWTLMDHAPALREFNHTPFKFTSFLKYHIAAFAPSRGVIEASVGDTLKFELEAPYKERDKSIAAEDKWDSTFSSFSTVASLLPQSNDSSTKVTYSYIVASAEVEWLQLVYNNDFILRYKLIVTERKAGGRQ